MKDGSASKCCQAEYVDGKIQFTAESEGNPVCGDTADHTCSWSGMRDIARHELNKDNVHQQYTMCLLIEDQRLQKDRDFDLITSLREDAEGDDFDEEKREKE